MNFGPGVGLEVKIWDTLKKVLYCFFFYAYPFLRHQVISHPYGPAFHVMTGWPLVKEKSGKFDFSSRSGKSQGILQIDPGDFRYQESQGIS